MNDDFDHLRFTFIVFGHVDGALGVVQLRLSRCDFDGGYNGIGLGDVVAMMNPNGDEENPKDDDEEEICAEQTTSQKTICLLVRQHVGVSENG